MAPMVGRTPRGVFPRLKAGGHRLGAAAGLLLLMFATSAPAQQYRSEVRELPQTPADAGGQDPAELLRRTREPYPRALLLRELAGRAAQQGQYRQAADYLDQALATGALSGVAEAQMREDLLALRSASGDADALIRSLEAQRRAGRELDAAQRAALGAAYASKKRYAEALPWLRGAVAEAGPSVDSSWLRALLSVYAGLGDERMASELAQQVLRREPSSPESWQQAVAWQLKRGQRDRAQALMELAARLGFLDEAGQRLQLVRLTASIGAPFEAGSMLRHDLDDGRLPDTAEARRLLAECWLAARESALAVPAIEASLADRRDAGLLLQLGQLQMDRERYEEAAAAFERAVAAGADAQFPLAMARYQLADVDGALSALRGSRRQDRLVQDWIAYLESGRAREQAMQAAVSRQRRQSEDAVQLAARLGGAAGSPVSSSPPPPVQDGDTGSELTPVGALRRGTADGSIPAWPDPRPAAGVERPLYTITAANADRYAAQLSDGHRALLDAVPGFSMPVYPTHRDVVYPESIEAATQANLGSARLDGADALVGARLGFPFPQPQTGVEVLWNHRLRWRGRGLERRTTQMVVQADGSIGTRIKQHERMLARYADPQNPVDLSRENVLLYYLTWFEGSGNDFLALVHETANAGRGQRAIWVQPPGVRRLFRIPPVGYDQPFPGSEGLYFVDMLDMYNGNFDRYVWKLEGRRELLVGYGNEALAAGRSAPEQWLRPGHLDAAALRYEKHRVWVVEAEERPGHRHSFGRRRFYVDEDSWNVVLVENHDRDGRLWRVQEGHLWYRQDIRAADSTPVVTYDLKDGRLFLSRVRDRDDPEADADADLDRREFLPASVTSRYIR